MGKVYLITAVVSALAAVAAFLILKGLEIDAGGWGGGIAGGVGGAVGAILTTRHKKAQRDAEE